jgi:CheY-like chemotaxis protein
MMSTRMHAAQTSTRALSACVAAFRNRSWPVVPARQPGEAGAAPARGRRRVLIVEDEAIIAWELSAMVEDLGYEVCGMATTATEAVRLEEATTPDVVLMDVRLRPGGGDGVDAAAGIRARRDVPIVFCTAYSHDPSMVARMEAVGAAGLLSKPFQVGILKSVLDRLLTPPRSS